MDQRIMKLSHLLGDQKVAEALVAAGLDTPAKVKAAKDKDLEVHVGKAKVAAIRKRLPKAKPSA